MEHLHPADVGRVAAAHLAASLADGWRPSAIPSSIARYEGESVYASAGFRLAQFAGANVAYNKGWFVGLGSPLFLAASLGGSLLYNRHQKSKAERQATPQWRPLNDGVLHITNRRLGLQGRLGWVDIHYSTLRATECAMDGIVIFLDGESPLLLSTVWPEYYFVLFRWLAYGEIPAIYLEDRLRPYLAAARGLGQGPTPSA